MILSKFIALCLRTFDSIIDVGSFFIPTILFLHFFVSSCMVEMELCYSL